MRVRKAKLSEAAEILALMQPYVEQGVLLPRSLRHICENIRDFAVIEAGGGIVASGALHFLDEDVAEVQGLAVHPRWQGRGLGRRIVQSLLREARRLQAWKVFALTHRPGFFEQLGFEATERAAVPQKFARDCVVCPKLRHCEQKAVIFDVLATATRKRRTAVAGRLILNPSRAALNAEQQAPAGAFLQEETPSRDESPRLVLLRAAQG
jgi:amino-acid N-acetyltransferase